MRVYRLRVVIPLVLCLFTAVATTLYLLERLNSTQQQAQSAGRDELTAVMMQLQDSVYSSMAREDTLTAQNGVSMAALDPIVSRILFVDDSGRVLLADDSGWLGKQASMIADYDRVLADKAVQSDSGQLVSSGQGVTLRGYYPVIVASPSIGLRRRMGVLFVVADLSSRFEVARMTAYASAGYFSLFAILAALGIAVMLHYTVTKGVDSLTRSFEAAAGGDLSVRSGVSGRGELALLGESFDAMTEQLASQREALQQSEARYHALFDAGNDPTYIHDLEGKILEVNDAACEVMGYSRDELLAMTISRLDSPEDASQVPARIATIVGGQRALFETVHIAKDGTRIPMEVSSRLITYGGESAILSVCRDLTSRREAERERTRLTDVLDRSLNEIYMCDPETLRFTYVNAGARKNLGYSADQLSHMTVLDIKPEFTEESFRELLRPLYEGRQDVLVYETQHLRADGSTYPVESHLQLVHDGDEGVFLVVVTDTTERKAAEEALRESEAKFRTFADLTYEWEFWVGPDSKFVYVSPSCERTTGYTAEEFLANPHLMTEIVHPDDCELVGDHFDVVDQETCAPFDYRIVTRSGEVRWIGHSCQPVYDGERWLGRRASCIDITERKMAEQAALSASAYARSLIEASLDPLVTISPEGKVTDVNEATEQVTGVARGQLIGSDFSDYFTEPERARDGYRHVLEKGFVRDYPLAIRNVSGATIDVLYNASLYQDESGETLGVFAAARDITERKRSEDELREKTVKLDRFFTLAPDLLCIVDSDGRFLELSRAVESMLGYGLDEMLGHAAYEFVHPDDVSATRDVIENLSTGGTLTGFTNRYRCKDGSHRWLEWRAVWAEGLIYAAARDVTERRQAEELRIAKEAAETANVAKSAFLANMSHEIRTPMNAILGFAKLMRQDPGLTQRQRKQLDIINSSGEHLLALINDVLEMSKIEAGRATVSVSAFDLRAMLRELELLFNLRAQAKGLRFEIQGVDATPSYIETDENKLRQVLVNLIGNAVKFTAEGSVVIRIGLRPGVDGSSDLLRVEVADTGPGIAPDEIDRLFQYFGQGGASSPAEPGTGLGLAISRDFVELLGGKISVSSQVGRGSTFAFEIPVIEVAEGEVAHGVEGRRVVGIEPGQPHFKILVADDTADNRELLTQMLAPVGFDIRCAPDGAETLAEFHEWRPHIILLDMRMPVMDGYEVLRRLRRDASGREVKVIAVTASAFMEMRHEVLLAGADDFVSKPVDQFELLDKIARAIGVKYVYEEVAGEEQQPEIALDREQMASLSPELIQRLRQAAIAADFDEVSAVADELAPTDEGLAAMLRTVVSRYDAEGLLGVLAEADNARDASVS